GTLILPFEWPTRLNDTVQCPAGEDAATGGCCSSCARWWAAATNVSAMLIDEQQNRLNYSARFLTHSSSYFQWMRGTIQYSGTIQDSHNGPLLAFATWAYNKTLFAVTPVQLISTNAPTFQSYSLGVPINCTSWLRGARVQLIHFLHNMTLITDSIRLLPSMLLTAVLPPVQWRNVRSDLGYMQIDRVRLLRDTQSN